jgi:hypothetical protein
VGYFCIFQKLRKANYSQLFTLPLTSLEECHSHPIAPLKDEAIFATKKQCRKPTRREESFKTRGSSRTISLRLNQANDRVAGAEK